MADIDDVSSSGEAARAVGSLTDIARIAGVSIATASRVLNGSTHPVSDKLRKRVLEVADQHHYRPSLLAQAIAKQQSKIIGVIVHDAADPYFAEIVQGIESVAIAAGYLPIVTNSARSAALEIERIRLFSDYMAKGIIFTGSGPQGGSPPQLHDMLESAKASGMKIVSLASRDFPSRAFVFDNEQAAFDITNHLISQGAKRIAFVAGSIGVLAATERQRGYELAMREAGLEPLISQGTFKSESGVAAALNLLTQGTVPDAVVGSNDQTAVGVMAAFHNAGIDVPRTLKVAGIGATGLARILDLTSVGVHLQTFGGLAAKYVIDDDQPESDERSEMPHTIEARGSTAS
jgi:LacI family transcriptional regulator